MRHIQGEQKDWFSQPLSDIVSINIYYFSINIDSEGKTFQFFRGQGHLPFDHNNFLETNKIFICIFEKGL